MDEHVDEYYAFIARAVARLGSSQTRREIYASYRESLLTEFRRSKPSASESELEEVGHAFDKAARRFEEDASRADGGAARPPEAEQSYKCDICSTALKRASGYCYSTTQVVNSIGYWITIFQTNADAVRGDGSAVGMFVAGMIHHTTPWLVCAPCSVRVDADAKAAREYAVSGNWPPGCGAADANPAAITAAYAWSLLFGEWPTSVQVGTNPITHDPEKGARCNFCRRIVYGEDKFGVFAPEMYAELVSRGAKFVRNPDPSFEINGKRYHIGCLLCLERSGAGLGEVPVRAAASIEQAASDERYCTYHRKVIALEAVQRDGYRFCSASFATSDNPKPCLNSLCIHNVVTSAVAEAVLEQKGIVFSGAAQAEVERFLLERGLKDEAPHPPSQKKASKRRLGLWCIILVILAALGTLYAIPAVRDELAWAGARFNDWVASRLGPAS